MRRDQIVVLGLSGRGDKDMGTVADALGVKLP
jgi:tryptophan synthase beta subunit